MKSLLNFLKEKAWIICLLLLGFVVYSHFFQYSGKLEDAISINNKGEVVEKIDNANITSSESLKSNTVISVKPKPTSQHPDLVMEEKQKFIADINGKKFEVKPKDKESFEYGEDYISINKESTLSMQIETKPLEPQYGLGVGVDTKGNPAVCANVRLKKSPIYFWGVSNFKEAHMIGVGIYGNFN